MKLSQLSERPKTVKRHLYYKMNDFTIGNRINKLRVKSLKKKINNLLHKYNELIITNTYKNDSNNPDNKYYVISEIDVNDYISKMDSPDFDFFENVPKSPEFQRLIEDHPPTNTEKK